MHMKLCPTVTIFVDIYFLYIMFEHSEMLIFMVCKKSTTNRESIWLLLRTAVKLGNSPTRVTTCDVIR